MEHKHSHQKFTLKNGLRVIFAPMPATQAATVLTLFSVGSRNETHALNGAAHYIEHMMFKGTEKRPTTLDISRELDRVGAEYNAYTGKDRTGYWITTAQRHLELALDVTFDMLLHSKFDHEEVERERKVIMEEMKMYEENPLMHIEDLFERAMFAGHELGWNIAGTKETMAGIGRKELVAFKQRFYYPRNTVVIVAGSFNEAQTRQSIEEHMAGFRSGPKTPERLHPFHFKKASKVALHRQQVDQVQLALGFPSYGYGHKSLPALHLLNVVLGGNMSSRLFISVRERRALAYSVRSSADQYAETGSFKVRAGLDASRVEEAVHVILDELEAIKQGVSAKELADAKEYTRGKLGLALEDSAELATWYGDQELFLRKMKTPDEQLKKIDAVTLAQVKTVAQDLIKRDKLRCAIIGPWSDKTKFTKLF
ncbi:MAG: pitrilysin family protein [Patescibacteria group bacterium]|mgnify:CR=1 FL=1